MSEGAKATKAVLERLEGCKVRARELRASGTEKRNAVLLTAAELLTEKMSSVIEANKKDLAALPADTTSAFKDRLTLNEDRIMLAVDSLQQVAALEDPVGEEVGRGELPNGLLLRRVRAPLGVILLIFESRPNVALEAFSLAFKAGNIAILRGGKESTHSTGAIYAILEEALQKNEMSSEFFWGIANPDREIVKFLLPPPPSRKKR